MSDKDLLRAYEVQREKRIGLDYLNQSTLDAELRKLNGLKEEILDRMQVGSKNLREARERLRGEGYGVVGGKSGALSDAMKSDRSRFYEELKKGRRS